MDYARLYARFIEDRKQKQPTAPAYFERHHILPRSMGGGDEAANIVRLTAEDHIFAHLLLARWHGTRDAWAAVKFVFGQGKRVGRTPTRREIRLAAQAKEQFAAKNSGPNNANFGKPVSDERRQRLREVNLGKKHSDEHRAAISRAGMGRPSPQRGKKLSAERVEQIRQQMAGFKHSDAAKAKIGAAHAGREKSAEHRKKLSDAKKGMCADHLHTPEARARRGAKLRGRPKSAETIAKMSAAAMGRTVSLEARAAMSAKRVGAGNARAKPVTCITTGEVFGCVKDAAIHHGIPQPTLRSALNLGNGVCRVRGLEFEARGSGEKKTNHARGEERRVD